MTIWRAINSAPLQRTILYAAAWLVPSEQRQEWLAEWKSELWHVRRRNKESLAFCLGHFVMGSG